MVHAMCFFHSSCILVMALGFGFVTGVFLIMKIGREGGEDVKG